jgi:hypothetical protein
VVIEMGVWQIIWIVFMGISLCANAFMHGREIKVNFWTALISTGVHVLLLALGGFFTAG